MLQEQLLLEQKQPHLAWCKLTLSYSLLVVWLLERQYLYEFSAKMRCSLDYRLEEKEVSWPGLHVLPTLTPEFFPFALSEMCNLRNAVSEEGDILGRIMATTHVIFVLKQMVNIWNILNAIIIIIENNRLYKWLIWGYIFTKQKCLFWYSPPPHESSRYVPRTPCILYKTKI